MRISSYFKSLGTAGLISAGVFLSGCGETKVAPSAARTAEVATVVLGSERVVLTTELPGRTASYLVAEIRPQVSGLLQKRLFEEGANIKAGDLLYQIDPTPYQAVHDQAKAALVTAEANVATAEANVALAETSLPAIRLRAERLKGLVAIRAVGQQDYDDANAALLQAEANLAVRKTGVEASRAAVEASKTAIEGARINLSYTPIKAPISGRIGRSNITVGAMVTAYQGLPLAVIQQLDPIYVDVTQSSVESLRIRKNLESGVLKNGSGQRNVKLLLEDGTPYPQRGTLKFRDVTVDSTTGSITLRMVFANPKQVLLPGMFVRAVIEEGVDENAILVPQQGVNRDLKGNPIALVVDSNNKVEQRKIVLDRAIGDKWLVMNGLAAGDRLIVEGTQNVRPGDTVRVVESAAASTAGAPQSPIQAK
jgi:membrane fusion protein (multidrug efflux system)